MTALAERYAAALADVALEEGSAEQVKKDLSAFGELLAGSADLANLLANPGVTPADKHAVIRRLAARLGASKTVQNFLLVIVENRRAALLPQIRQAFETLLNVRLGIGEAKVTSAEELSAEQRAELTRALERLTRKRIEARYATDPALVGGVVVQVGSTIYDGSVREQLNRLRARLASE